MNTKDLLNRQDILIREGGAAIEAVLTALAEEATQDGKLHPPLLETRQPELFRIAHLHTEWQAAREMQIYGSLGELEAMLALVYGNGALAGMRAQLPALGQLFPAARDLCHGLLNNQEMWEVGRLTGGSEFIGNVWESITAGQSDGQDVLKEEHRMLRNTFRAFAEKKVRPLAERFHREDLLIPDDLIGEVSKLGCFGLSIPLEYGGIQEQPDFLGVVVVTEELSRGALIFGSLITRPEILAKALLRGGTPRQKERFLPAIASGEKMVAISVTEPDYGSDVSHIATSARRDGEGWRLNGTKTFSTFAGRAELIALLARSESDPTLGHRGLSLFIIEKPPFAGRTFEYTSPGGGTLRARAIPTAGYRGMHSFEMQLEDFYLPGENLVGEEGGQGRGFYLQMEGFSGGRLQTAGRALGVMQAAYEQAKSYSRERRVFGKPLADYPLTRQKLVTMAAALQAGRQTTYAAARLMSEGEGQVEASMAKFLTCRQAEWVTREAMQLHGAMGYAEEFPLSRLFIDARVLSIFEGTEEVLALKVIVPSLLRDYMA